MTGPPARAAAAGPGVVAALAAVSGHGGIAILLVLVAVALALAESWGSAWMQLPTAAVVVGGVVLVATQGAGVVNWALLSDRWTCRFALAALGLGAGVLAWWRSRGWEVDRAATDGPGGAWSRVAAVPAVVMAGWGLVLCVLTFPRAVQWSLGADHLQHLVYAAQLHRAGALSYDQVSYPRAWHAVMALVWGAGDGTQGTQGLRGLLTVMAAGSWTAYALLVLATSVVAVRLFPGRTNGLGQGQITGPERGRMTGPERGAAGLVAGSLALWPSFVSDYMGYGFETSVAGGLVIAVAVLEVLGARSPGPARAPSAGLRAVLVTGLCVALMAHTWQLLLPVVAIPFVVALLGLVRSGGPRRHWTAAAVTLLVCLVSWPPVLAVFTQVGLDHAVDAGLKPRVPLVWLGLGLLACGWLVVRRPFRGAVLIPVMTAVGVGSALGLTVLLGISPLRYYPAKLLWQCALLSLPVLGVLAVQVRQRLALGRSTVARLADRTALAAAGVVVLVCLVTPVMASAGQWSNVHADAVLTAAATPDAVDADVVWLGGTDYDDLVVRVMLDFFRVEEGRDVLDYDLRVPTRAEECGLLEQQTRPTVLSAAPEAAVRLRYPCVSRLRVVPTGP